MLAGCRALIAGHVPTSAITVSREAIGRAMIVKSGVGGAPPHSWHHLR